MPPTIRPRGMVACAAATPTAIFPTACLLCTVVVIASGSAIGTIYDNATAANGTKLLVIPANTAVGTVYDIWLPSANGLYYDGITSSPAINVSIA
jgi:hypothetical protein